MIQIRSSTSSRGCLRGRHPGMVSPWTPAAEWQEADTPEALVMVRSSPESHILKASSSAAPCSVREVRRVEFFGKPAVDGGEQVVSFVSLAPLSPIDGQDPVAARSSRDLAAGSEAVSMARCNHAAASSSSPVSARTIPLSGVAAPLDSGSRRSAQRVPAAHPNAASASPSSTRLKVGFGQETEPLSTEHVGTEAIPGGQARLKVGEPLHLLAEADQSKALAHGGTARYSGRRCSLARSMVAPARARAAANSRRQLRRTAVQLRAKARLCAWESL